MPEDIDGIFTYYISPYLLLAPRHKVRTSAGLTYRCTNASHIFRHNSQIFYNSIFYDKINNDSWTLFLSYFISLFSKSYSVHTALWYQKQYCYVNDYFSPSFSGASEEPTWKESMEIFLRSSMISKRHLAIVAKSDSRPYLSYLIRLAIADKHEGRIPFLLVPTVNFKLFPSRFKMSALQGCWAFPRFSRLRFDEPRPIQQQQQVSRWTALFLKLTISRWQCPLWWWPAFEDFRCDIKRNFKSYNEESDRRDRHFSFHWTLNIHIASWSKRKQQSTECRWLVDSKIIILFYYGNAEAFARSSLLDV